jgi:hypothetical protein
LSIDVSHVEEVEVRSEDAFGGRGALEFGDEARNSPHLWPLSRGERGNGSEKISGSRSGLCGAA